MSVNQCNFLGRVGQIETKYIPSGEAVTNISLACNEKYKNKSGEMVEHCEWIRIAFFGKQAEILQKYVNKGDQLFASGSMRTRKYKDKDGIEKQTTEIRGDRFDFVGGKPSEGAAQSSAPSKQASGGSGGGSGFSDMEDDIPFIDCNVSHDMIASLQKRMNRYVR